MIIWIHGKSNSGKTILAKQILKEVKNYNKTFVHIDGDEIRKIFSNNDYSLEGRLKNAKFIQNLVFLLNKNKVNVIVSTLSIFKKILILNRKKIKNYFEILIKSKQTNLYKRDKRNIYSKRSKTKRNVVGEDIKYLDTKSYDFVIDNNSTKKELLNNAKKIIRINKLNFF